MKDTYPKISIVTPSFNQGQFIEATIESVISQNYPNLEYIIIDAGSTDNTHSILEKYKNFISIIKIEPDEGAPDAILKGFQLCSGEWFNWLNSDDILLPNSLLTLASINEFCPDAAWISGGRLNIFENGDIGDSCVPWRTGFAYFACGHYFFPQDATFIKSDFLRENLTLFKKEFTNVYDTYLYHHLCEIQKPLLTSAIFSAMRWHSSQKSAQIERLAYEHNLIAPPLCQYDLRHLPLGN